MKYIVILVAIAISYSLAPTVDQDVIDHAHNEVKQANEVLKNGVYFGEGDIGRVYEDGSYHITTINGEHITGCMAQGLCND